jgi:hypothetical protein
MHASKHWWRCVLVVECPAGLSRCSLTSTECVNSSLVCDGVEDCQDGSDERLCRECRETYH